ncbi:protein NRT1/ PTR FAMILY 4.6-like isoform X2 [Andrographis paniculata]|uniref:protein NRT1/ PTR FAMILY 4.6-like isoform X2 n=1 Tax=Andrographis paniculata TaxID=175694 RepID=UPI0021E74AF8|nr:protein NRT1/ PTR FAMILY 4.6-like isoform X2 [Andrographis paniculata]XP_051134277.1 protein NRT1/ PTR FAMILY 4.6-like isoform X2 [Andrographis paniculata]
MERLYSMEPRKQGGFRACMFVFVLGALENIGFAANISTMYLYFHRGLFFSISASANTLTNFLGSTFLLTVVGGFISDTYLNRLHTCLFFGFLEILGLLMLTIQANTKNLQPDPDPCNNKQSCIHGGKAFMFYTSLCMLALGYGGVKGSIAALGADQFDRSDPEGAKGVASYFNYFQFSTTIGSLIGVTAVVWIALDKGWHWAFFTSLVTAFVGFVVLALGKPFYLFQPLATSPIVRISQVIIGAIRNRNLSLPENSDELYKGRDSCEERVVHTDQFRFLDKAAVPWPRRQVCTVTQVEEVKILLRMAPIFGSTIILNTCLAQLQTFSVLQGSIMEPHLATLNIPSPSIPVIPLLFMAIFLPLYEIFFIPFARKITGHPSGITQLQRVGIGLALSVLSMVIAGIVEVKRREQALADPEKPPISLFWLSFQYGVFGVADMFAMVGLMEFFYKEAPSGMRSLSTSLTLLSLSFGYFLSTAFVHIFNAVTKKITSDKQGWLQASDLDHSRLSYFYWFLAVLSAINFGNYLFWASWFNAAQKSDQDSKTSDFDPMEGGSGLLNQIDSRYERHRTTPHTGQLVVNGVLGEGGRLFRFPSFLGASKSIRNHFLSTYLLQTYDPSSLAL